ncbi:MAG TPA: hypothetical protein PLM56_17130 [Cyclobacteriaceae bacterium]|nr:hypothetical protein [Cytophagales bacterium]HRE65357.1 hypothetical protein [Cyclobacteriaceae bacterium]HRF35232.1 hypothetical protein [Cyclobacteriaceae bacterium]
MRGLSVFSFAALSLLLSCENLETISLETSQTVTFLVNEPTTNSNGIDYEVTSAIDISQNPDLTGLLNRIKQIKINHIEYVISGADPQGISLNNASIETSSGLDIVVAKSIALTNASSGELKGNPPGVNDLNTRLQGSGTDQLKLFGDLSRTPLVCTVTVTFHLTVKANAI